MKELLSENGKKSLMRLIIFINTIITSALAIAITVYSMIHGELVSATGLILGVLGAGGIGEVMKVWQKKHENKG